MAWHRGGLGDGLFSFNLYMVCDDMNLMATSECWKFRRDHPEEWKTFG